MYVQSFESRPPAYLHFTDEEHKLWHTGSSMDPGGLSTKAVCREGLQVMIIFHEA